MAGEKNVSITAKIKSVNVTSGAKTAKADIPTISANVSSSILNAIATGFDNVFANTSNLGEDNIPDYTTLFKTADIFGITDSLKTNFIKGNIDTVFFNELQKFTVSKVILNQTNLFDLLSTTVDFKRTFIDTAVATDDIYGNADLDDQQYAQVIKSNREYLNLSDNKIFSVSKANIEPVAIQTSIDKGIEKPISNNSLVSDINSKILSSLKLDNTTVNNVFSSVTSFIRDFVEASNILDNSVITINKLISELISFNDLVSLLSFFNRTFNETLSFSTSQIFDISKRLSDSPVITDALIFTNTFNRAFVNQAVSSDVLIFVTLYNRDGQETVGITTSTKFSSNKSISNISETNDTISFENTFNRSFSNIYSLQDISYSSLSKPVSNIFSLNDIIGFNLSKPISSSGTTTDSLFTNTNKINLDSSIIDDSLSSSTIFNRTFNNSVNATDDIFGNADLDDQQYAQFIKSVVDYTTVSDTISIGFLANIIITDNGNIADNITRALSKLFQNPTSISDTTSNGIGKLFSDNSGVTSFSYRTINKQNQDSLAVTDSRTAIVQSYFASVDYVDLTYTGTTYTI